MSCTDGRTAMRWKNSRERRPTSDIHATPCSLWGWRRGVGHRHATAPMPQEAPGFSPQVVHAPEACRWSVIVRGGQAACRLWSPRVRQAPAHRRYLPRRRLLGRVPRPHRSPVAPRAPSPAPRRGPSRWRRGGQDGATTRALGACLAVVRRPRAAPPCLSWAPCQALGPLHCRSRVPSRAVDRHGGHTTLRGHRP
jgi:hypothetical protein